MLNSNVKKVCNFYAGEGHFLSTVIPYLVSKAKENNRIILVTDDVTSTLCGIRLFVDRYFKSDKNVLYRNLDLVKMSELNALDIGMANIICIKDGFKHDILNTLILYINIELIRCYPIECGDEDMRSVISDNEYILNTRGIFEVKEVFSFGGIEKQKCEHSSSVNVN